MQVGAGLFPLLAGHVGASAAGQVFILSSPPVWALWGAARRAPRPGAAPTVLLLPPGEQAKRLGEVERLLEELAGSGADRGSLLLAFGGGIVGDVGGFVAAIYMRGIRYLQVPTTLLAQVDSAVGGKTGVNLQAGKNLAGAFHHPEAVFADVRLLSTLPPRELRAGLMESVKAGLIRDPALFQLLEAHAAELLAPEPAFAEALLEDVVARSVAIKAAVVGADEREGGLRMILNFGHTVGHAIEVVTGYGELLHGEAVGWGMLVALLLGQRRGLLAAGECTRAGALIRLVGALPRFHADPRALLEATARDKKNRAGTRRFVLPRGIGDALVVEDVKDPELLDAIRSVLASR